jgi:hypothetical protein
LAVLRAGATKGGSAFKNIARAAGRQLPMFLGERGAAKA